MYSTQRATSDGTLILLDISIDYLERENITVLFDSVQQAVGTTWDWVGATDKRISFTPAVPAGVNVDVVRTSDLSEVRHLFAGGAAFLPETMDENFNHILQIAQEARERATLQDVFQNIDMHGFQLVNLAPGTATGHSVEYSQLVVHDAVIVGYKNTTQGYRDQAQVYRNQAAASAAAAAAERIAAEAAKDAMFNDLSSTVAGKGAGLVGFVQSGTGAVVRNVQEKLREFVSVKDFGAVGDGVADDTAALTNFFNSAISRPGVEHRFEAKIYAVSALLPTINVSNVVIKGEGSEIHDVGTPLVTGTVLKWIGSPGTVGPLVKLSSISGASNQRVSNVEFSGIGIDCNSGAINYGIELSSIRDSIVDVAVANAGATGMSIGVVASLGEAKDVQRNIIRLKARQVEKRNAFCLTAGGDAVANTSMNELWVDCQHTDLQAIYLSNVDNNDWVFVRTYKVPGGTATESISLLGGATDAERCRAERFHFLTCNLPVHVYGTSGSPSFAFASANHKIYCLDTENGSPVPTVDTGGSIRVQKDTTNLADDPWVSFTPNVSATSGTITSASATGFYIRRGKIVHVKIAITITTNGTGAGALGVTLPMATVGSMGNTFAGKERAVTGKGIVGYADAGVSVMYMQFADGTYCGGNGYVINMSGFYEVG